MPARQLTDKEIFMKAVTILCDTREKENGHVIESLDKLKVKHENKKLDCGDYSFKIAEKDFSMSCVIDRKANVDEIYNNIMEPDPIGKGKGGRIEKEMESAVKNRIQFVLLIENCQTMQDLKDYNVPAYQMKMTPNRKVADIGKYCYPRLRAWQQKNRYGIIIEFAKDNQQSAAKMLEVFYYYYQNYKKSIASRRSK